MYFVHILYSLTRDKYYVGSCENVQERLKKHNTNHSGFTGKTGDWIVKWTEEHPSKSEAMKREKQIKSWKSRKMIEKLITGNT
jgi:putative endonuclease